MPVKWNLHTCTHVDCMAAGNNIRVIVEISDPHCAICGRSMSLTNAIRTVVDDPFDASGQAIADAIDKDILAEVVEAAEVDEVNEWMRCRDGIDTAEIALKGFCDEIGAEVTKSRITDLCRELQDMIHTHYGLGD